MQCTLTWLGNAGFEFTLGRQILLVDPFLTRPPAGKVYFGRAAPDIQAIRARIHRCDGILITHAHFDHFMDTPEIARHTHAVIYGSENTCALAGLLGVPEGQARLVKAGERFTIGELRVEAIPAAHPWIPGYTRGQLNGRIHTPLRLREYRMDSCLSFRITWQGKRILVWSSTRTQGALPADLLICRAVSDQGWYRRMMEAARPRVVIPAHWDDMFRPLSEPVRAFFSPPRLAFPPVRRIDLGEFERKVLNACPGCRVLLPERFEEVKIEL